MNFQDIPADILTIRVKRTDGSAEALTEQPVLSVGVCHNRPDEIEIRLKDSIAFVRPVANADVRRLNSELAPGHAFLSQLANPGADGSIELQIAIFTGECLEMGQIEIGIDEYLENAVARIDSLTGRPSKDRISYLLDQRCCFRQGDREYFFLFAGSALAGTLPDQPITDEDDIGGTKAREDQDEMDLADKPHNNLGSETPLLKPQPTATNSFCLVGDGIRFVVTECPLPDGKSIFTVTRFTKAKKQQDRAIRLARGRLGFVDWTKTGEVQVLAKAQLSALIKNEGSYLKKWDEFGNLEGELLLKHAREVGCLKYCDLKQNRDGTVSVRIVQASQSAWQALRAGRVPEVEVVDQLPDYLKNQGLTFGEFVSGVETEEMESHGDRRLSSRYFTVSEFDSDSKTLTLATEKLPSESGTLILSLVGEIIQIKRRMKARRLILEGRSANPQLGLLIEENGKLVPTRQSTRVRPLTAFVREKVFRSSPTLMQEKAIEVALNTPDMAVIQGPPGTGKTTVIAAILERLNEMSDKRGASAKGRVLLTGFQHDAVENMIDRLSINSTPVPKFGKRSGSDDDDYGLFERRLEEWCSTIAARLRERNPQITEIEQETEIRNLCLQYTQVPTRALAKHLADTIASLGVAILGETLARRAAELAMSLSCEEHLNENINQLAHAVRSLRVRPESFADDGPERAADALDYLGDLLEEDERDLLSKASLWRDDDNRLPFLDELARLKKKLLVRLSTPPIFRVEKHNDQVISMAELALRRLREEGHSTKDAKSAALAEFLGELENNPYGMIDAVSDYSFAFAATCQQSVNRIMQIQKGAIGDDQDTRLEYEYVIVDEAARVSPRDLMVPLAQGKRIILVGDHRQLPHLIDDEIARHMEEGETGEEESHWLKKSMFQYLFSERLKALEEADGICRRVTLDKQYRMHPLLGDFVSRNFYERFDVAEKFESGRPASDFAHNLPGTDRKCAIWLDVAADKGLQQRSGTSWTRPVEAVAIIRQLKKWLESAAGRDLSFGVISFYKAQAELIKRQLDIVNDDKKLRIGTVDSFQGMEFDVVFLSIVRTLPRNWKPRSDDKTKQARGLFGHLCLYNRLNVSMSRQKKLLVVAGDSRLVQNDLAKEFIPGLVDFLDICRSQGRIVQCQ
ncbi:MAG: hypothetical protein Kow0040_24450 [Thermogutta sp.]